MRLRETTYGDARRFDFVCRAIEQTKPAGVLDVGCGTGTHLTRPLAEAFPSTRFIGIDADRGSIAWAQESGCTLANLGFSLAADLPASERFDLVIASEVIEHVDDPMGFLLNLRARLTENGRIVLTLPNGYGPFELMALTECLLNLTGCQALLRRLKYALLGRSKPPTTAERDTLAISPHVNFFSFREIAGLLDDAGLGVVRSANRAILCGYILDDLIRGERLIALNAAFADRLPVWCVSDWMFELRPAAAPGAPRWRRGAWARLRKRLNERRWQVKIAVRDEMPSPRPSPARGRGSPRHRTAPRP